MSEERAPNEVSDLLACLESAALNYRDAGGPLEVRAAWADQIGAIFHFLKTLGLPPERFTLLVAPLTDLVGALADLDRGTQPSTLKKVKRGGRGRKRFNEIAALARAAAVVDQLVEDGTDKDKAGQWVSRALQGAGLLPKGAGYATVLNFRRDLEAYGDEARDIRRAMREVIQQYQPKERSQVAKSLLLQGTKLRNPPS